MGWITRRIAGFITFAVVSSILGAYAILRGWISGEPTLSTKVGAIVLGIAFLASLAVTTHMKNQEKARKAYEEYVRQWQAYYARAGYYPPTRER